MRIYFGALVMVGISVLIVMAAIVFSPRCRYETGVVEVHVAIGGMLIAGCPDGKLPDNKGWRPL